MTKKYRAGLKEARMEVVKKLGKDYPEDRLSKARAYTVAIAETLYTHVAEEVLTKEELLLCLIAASEYLAVKDEGEKENVSPTQRGKDAGES